MTDKKITRIRIVDARQSYSLRLAKGMLSAAGIAFMFFGPGLLADSAAMQWAGFVLFILLIFVLLVAVSASELTISEARKKLDELEATQ